MSENFKCFFLVGHDTKYLEKDMGNCDFYTDFCNFVQINDKYLDKASYFISFPQRFNVLTNT